MPGESGCNRGEYARVLFHFAREAAGATGTRRSPLSLRAKVCAQLGAHRTAGMALSCPDLIRVPRYRRRRERKDGNDVIVQSDI